MFNWIYQYSITFNQNFLEVLYQLENLSVCNSININYYVQVNSQRLKSTVASKWQVNTFGGNIYFAGEGTYNTIRYNIFYCIALLR